MNLKCIKINSNRCLIDRKFEANATDKLVLAVVVDQLAQILEHMLVDHKYSALPFQSIMPVFAINA